MQNDKDFSLNLIYKIIQTTCIMIWAIKFVSALSLSLF